MYKILLNSLLLLLVHGQKPGWEKEKNTHQARALRSRDLKDVASLSDLDHFKSVLQQILKVRVVDTPAHRNVRDFIIKQMEGLRWNVYTDAFSEDTPLGMKNFHNIIATLNPDAPRRLVLACHYDSKYYPSTRKHKNKFVGAIDSAVPCSMMINLAYVMHDHLQATLQENAQQEVTLQFIFFDGEEAFDTWNVNSDAVYGARHLANQLEKKSFPTNNRAGTNELHRMDLFVLLDLLGTSDPIIPDYFPKQSGKWYEQLQSIEQRLSRENKLLQHDKDYFRTHPWYGANRIEDDHVHFMKKGVPILHVIPTPFPHVWHKEKDNYSALDFATIDNLNKIFRVFVAEYLHL